MTAPATDRVEFATARPPIPSGPGIPNINPATGLSTDYLNHFTEAVMALEMAANVPECLDDLKVWRPKSYPEHFAASRFSRRAVVIEAYRAAEPALRSALDRTSGALNRALVQARDQLLHRGPSLAADASARRALDDVRPLIVQLAALINGAAAASDRLAPQAGIDAIFGQ